MSNTIYDHCLGASIISFFPIKKYSSNYLKSFRYRNRSYNKYAYLMDYLRSLNIYKFFNARRGSRAGARHRDNHFSIKPVTSFVRRPKTMCCEQRPPVLTKISTGRHHYCFPTVFVTNLRSIANKFEQLCTTIEVYKPGILLLSETWINNFNVNAYEISGYKPFHRLRDRSDKAHGGGVSAYVKNDITVQQHKLSPIPDIEILTLICKPSYLPREVPWIGFIMVYFPPSDKNFNEFIGYIISEYDRLMAINYRAGIFIAGDFNGLDISAILRLPKIYKLSDLPTRGSNCLDLCLSNLKDFYEVRIFPPIAGSDHNLLFASPKQREILPSSVIEMTYRKKTKSGYGLMAQILSNHDWNHWSQINSVQVMADVFYDFINYLFRLAFPLVTEFKKVNSHPWMNRCISRMLKERDELAIKSGCFSNQYKSLCDKIKYEITAAKNLMCRNLLFKYKSSPREFYNLIKSVTICNENKSNSAIVFPESSASESRGLICEYFGNLLNAHPKCSFDFDSFLSDDDFLPKMEIFYVYNQLKNLPCNNACAPGDIPSHVYRELAEFLAEPLLILFNCSLTCSYVPSQWKCGYLITIPKVPVVKSPNQLRPIIITSPVAKIIERHILSVIKIGYSDFIDPMQFGSLPNRSACQYLSIYLHRVAMELENRGSSVTSIFTDYAKAFDSVSHDVLINMMIKLSINKAAIKWIMYFLEDRMTMLKDDYGRDNLSFTSSCGIPQGTVLGGFLFIIVINDLMKDYPCRLKYMDDMTISLINANLPQNLVQSAMDELVVQSNDLKIKLNIDKCILMHHSFSRDFVKPTASIEGIQLNCVNSVRLLGVIIQSNAKWEDQINSMILKANRKIHMIYILKRLGADFEVILDTYLTFIRPIIEYCAPVWHPALTKAQSNALEQVQKRITRLILGKDHTSYESDLSRLDLISLKKRRTELHTKFAHDFFDCFPEFLPMTRFQSTGVVTRNSNKLTKPSIRTKRADMSPIISFINSVNINM